MKIAVDVDGVIADQISPVLKRLNAKYRLIVTRADIRHWDEPIADTDIKTEIETSLLNSQFILGMNLIRGARSALVKLARKHIIIIATHRPLVSDQATQAWLHKKGIPYHHYVNTSTQGKASLSSDILIDDYAGNVVAFSARGRHAILFDQPWNADDSEVEMASKEGRVARAHGWQEVVEIIRGFEAT